MKRKLGPYLIGCLILVLAGVGVMIGQERSTFERKVAPPTGGAPEAGGVAWYWNSDHDDAPLMDAFEIDADAPQVMALPRQVERDGLFIRGEAGPWLGVVLSDISLEKAKELKLTGEYGVLVKEVREDSPAAKAGLMKDDVIVEFAGEKIRGAMQLRRLARETPPERTVSITAIRAGQTKNLTAKLAPRPEGAFEFGSVPPRMAMPMPHIEMPQFDLLVPHPGARLGISADELTPQLAQYFGVKQGKGILVREVTVGSAAEKAGLKAGDVIVSVDGKEVATVANLRRALAGEKETSEKRKVNLTIVREKREQTLSVELEPPQHVGPHTFVRTELGFDPEEMREMAEEARAQAQEAQQEWEEHAQQFADQQRELQLDQKQLQQEMQELQKQMPELEKEIKLSLGSLDQKQLQQEIRELQKQMPELEKEIKRSLGRAAVDLEAI